jgi:hypothetical protein
MQALGIQNQVTREQLDGLSGFAALRTYVFETLDEASRLRLKLENRFRFHRQLLHTPSFLLQRRRFHGEMIPAASAFGSTG